MLFLCVFPALPDIDVIVMQDTPDSSFVDSDDSSDFLRRLHLRVQFDNFLNEFWFLRCEMGNFNAITL